MTVIKEMSQAWLDGGNWAVAQDGAEIDSEFEQRTMWSWSRNGILEHGGIFSSADILCQWSRPLPDFVDWGIFSEAPHLAFHNHQQ